MLGKRIPGESQPTQIVPGGAAIQQVRAVRAQININGPSLAQVVWRRRWTLICCVLVALAVACVYLKKAIPIYSSSGLIYLEQSPMIISQAYATGNNPAANSFTQCEVIKSTAILSAALDLPGVRDAKSLSGVANPVGFLKSQIDAQVSKQGDIITVSVTSVDPDDAALFVNSAIEAYVNYQSQQHRSTAADVLRILQKEKDKRDAEYQSLAQQMLTFKKNNADLSFEDEKGNIIVQGLSELSSNLMNAQYDTLNCKITMDTADAAAGDPAKLLQLIASQPSSAETGVAGLSSELVGQYRQELRRVKSMRMEFGPAHPMVLKANMELDELKDEIAQSQQAALVNYVNIVHQRYETAKRKEEQLQTTFDQKKKQNLDYNIKAAEYGELQNEARRTEKMQDMLDDRIKELNVTEDSDAMKVTVLEPARPELDPVKPKKSQTLAMALVIGLMAGLGGTLLQDWMDQRLRSPEEISSLLDLPVLGIVPHIVGKINTSERGQEVKLKPRSDVAEAYRTVRTAIYFGSLDASQSKSMLVTSPAPGDGKTTMVSNIAIAIAQAGRRVLLIDADCRKPMQHRIFKVKPQIGLTSVLLGQVDAAAAIQKTDTEKLDVMPCGPVPTNPSELLNSQEFSNLIRDLSAQYDQIIIDSPPVVPVTDARILAAVCDATVLVLRAEKSTRRLSEHARDALASVGANVLGVVVNDVPRNRHGYGYYSGYGYYYRYGYGHNGKELNGNGHEGANGNGHLINGHSELRDDQQAESAVADED